MNGTPLPDDFTTRTDSSLQFFAFWAIGLSTLLTVTSEIEGAVAFAGRFAYWLLHIGVGLGVVTLTARWLQRMGLNALQTWMQLVITGVVGSIAFVPFAILLEQQLPPTYAPTGHGDFAAAAAATTNGILVAVWEEFLALVPITSTIWVIINFVYIMHVGRANETAPLPNAPIHKATHSVEDDRHPHKSEPTGLIAKLKPALGADIIVIRSDLNYLHVQTTLGQTMLIYSLTRAADEFGSSGLIVHRSYWIAKHHVNKVVRDGRQYLCVMSDGSRVPVSRRRQSGGDR